MKNYIFIGLLAVLAMVLNGCEDGKNPNKLPQSNEITVIPTGEPSITLAEVDDEKSHPEAITLTPQAEIPEGNKPKIDEIDLSSYFGEHKGTAVFL